VARPKKHSASDEPEALAARQREHRLMIRVQPKEPVDSRADPWVVADEGLDALDNIRQLLRPGGQALEELDVAGERLRRLAWGPGEPRSADPTFDLTTNSGRMRRNMHKRWHRSGLKPCNCRPGPSV